MKRVKVVAAAVVVAASAVTAVVLSGDNTELRCARPKPRALLDGGLDLETPVDCRRQERLAFEPGVTVRWAGFNVFPKEQLLGSECEPVQCPEAP